MIKPINDEMITLLNKAKSIISESKKQGIDLTINAKINHDRPTCYQDIINNKEELLTLRKEVARLDKEYKDGLAKNSLQNIDTYLKEKKDGKYGEVLVLGFKNEDMSTLKQLVGALLNKLNSGIVFIYNIKDTSVNYLAKCDDSLKDKINMGELIKNVSVISDGNGGGSATFAQGGGTDADKIDMVESYINDKIISKE